jgi:hypothetical protein
MSSQRITPTTSVPWIWPILVVVVAGGIWYVVGTNGTTLNANNSDQKALNANVNSNDNTNSSQTKLYQGNGFSVRYPTNWAVVEENGTAPRFTPKDVTFYLEGSIDYPVSVGTTTKSADEYVFSLPADKKSKVIVNGYSGYRAYSNCPTCGQNPFYVFTLANKTSSVVVSYMGDVLEQTAGPTVDKSVLHEVFEQMVNSLQMQ